ncbi:phosphate ABC transporter substrate-binding protein PstS [Glaciihabitans sp. dw_435]|uniref:phosphate ABC transporter substrate-binding protein PstS n=1 Tax=Glaciihabitans sp. dw_435 TaxID=2720081 RepID=UPI001BD46912|nr:phosphate ABC transporter substrate-binding protein PstS [Glaciihabitans sp. dw_435]
MKFSRIGSIAAVAVAATIVLSSCASNEAAAPSDSNSAAALTGTLAGIGSSAQGTAQTNWIKNFQTENPDVTINYDPQGSGAGRTAFISGAADFAGSDAALKDEELSGTFGKCAPDSKAIDLPVYISPIAIAYNVDGLTDLKLDADTVAGIFKGTIKTWNDKAITALNPDATLPSAKITVVHRSDDSGTTQNFAQWVSANAPTVWDAEATQTYPYKVGDAAKGTSGVADAVKSSPNSITYIDDSAAGDFGKAQLKVGDAFSTISAEGAAAVVAKSPLVEGRETNDLAINIDRKNTEANAWPLVLVSYLITCQTYTDPAVGTLVKAYAGYVASADGQTAAATAAKSAPLSTDLSSKVAAAIATIK